MNWIIDNGFIVVGVACLVFVIIFAAYKFVTMVPEKQKTKVKEWLIWACIEAEKDLQSGTGQLKLRKVYNKFCSVLSFTGIARLVSFDTFSTWVTSSLTTVKEMLVANRTLAEYVYGDNVDEEVEKLKAQLEKGE